MCQIPTLSPPPFIKYIDTPLFCNFTEVIWGPRSAQEMWCCVVRIYMNCSLSKCLLSFLRCIRMTGRCSGSIYKFCMVSRMCIVPNIHSNFKQIYQVWRHQISPGNVMLSCDDRHDRSTLLCKCFPILLRCMKMISTVSGSISNSLMVNILSFIPNIC